MFSSIIVVLYTRNSFQMDKPLIKNIIWTRRYEAFTWECESAGKGQICEKNNSRILPHALSHTSTRIFDQKLNKCRRSSASILRVCPPCDFLLFPKLKLPLRRRRFQSTEAVKENSWEEYSKQYQLQHLKCFEDWIKRWHMYGWQCIAWWGLFWRQGQYWWINKYFMFYLIPDTLFRMYMLIMKSEIPKTFKQYLE